MRDERPDEAAKSLWRSQETETPAMSVETLRARADAFHRKSRVKNLIGVAICIGSAPFFAAVALTAQTEIIRAGLLIMVAGAVWMGWWMGRLWPEALPDESASGQQLVDVQLAALHRQLGGARRMMLLGAPIFLGLAVELAGLIQKAAEAGRLGQLIPILVFLALWLTGAWWLNRRQQRALRRRIAELEALRRG